MEHNELQIRLTNLTSKYPNEDIELIYNTAIGFYNSVTKRWPPSTFRRVLDAEGGRNGLVYAFTIHGIAASPKHLKGFIEYSNYIRRLYYLGEKYAWAHMASLDEVNEDGRGMYDYVPAPLGVLPIDMVIAEEVGEADSFLSESAPDRPPEGAILKLLPPMLRFRKPLTPKEVDFLWTYAHCGNMAEASRFVGKDRRWGYGVLRRVRKATRVGV